jgi:exosortase
VNKEFSSSSRTAVGIFAATILLFLPTWLWLGDAWMSDPYYSHGPLVLLISLYLVWTRRKLFSNSSPAPNNLGLILIAIGFAIHLWAIVWRAFYLSALMIPLVMLGLIVTLFGHRIAKQFLFPLGFLILMVPLPLAERVGPVLEGWTATSATAFAQRLGVPAQNIGSQVLLPNSAFTVGIPCGGLRSTIAILTLVTLFAYVVRGAGWARALIFLVAIPIALAANTLRLALLFAIANGWGAQAGLDYFDSPWSSLVLFLSAFALLLALAKLIGASNVRWEVVTPS